jgi:hypothetical protein
MAIQRRLNELRSLREAASKRWLQFEKVINQLQENSAGLKTDREKWVERPIQEMRKMEGLMLNWAAFWGEKKEMWGAQEKEEELWKYFNAAVHEVGVKNREYERAAEETEAAVRQISEASDITSRDAAARATWAAFFKESVAFGEHEAARKNAHVEGGVLSSCQRDYATALHKTIFVVNVQQEEMNEKVSFNITDRIAAPGNFCKGNK